MYYNLILIILLSNEKCLFYLKKIISINYVNIIKYLYFIHSIIYFDCVFALIHYNAL